MPCFKPQDAYLLEEGGITYNSNHKGIQQPLTLPCRGCIGCRAERARQWAIRCTHEASMHKKNTFITLTYDEEHLPADSSLNYKHYQLFMKKLRKKYGTKIRFYMAGEYGSQTKRPHYHAILFNHMFDDATPHTTSKSGKPVLVSSELTKLWGKGFASIGEVNYTSCHYIAKYIIEKITGDPAEDHYRHINKDTGEITQRTPEFNRMSLRPGIGKPWYDKYKRDIINTGSVVTDGHQTKIPAYYDRLFQEDFPFEYDDYTYQKILMAHKFKKDNTEHRLQTREFCALEARKRNLNKTLI